MIFPQTNPAPDEHSNESDELSGGSMPSFRPVASTDLIDKYTKSINSFAFKLYDRVCEVAGDGENVFASPVSIATALTMVLNGAKGATRNEMEKVLESSGLSLDELNTATRTFKEMLQTLDEKVTVNIANSIWPSTDIKLVEDFDSEMKGSFDAEVLSLDYRGGNAEEIINTWVSDKTNGMIEKIVADLPADTLNVLVNAIYFYGSWTKEFDADLTEQEDFNPCEGPAVKVDMMKQTDKFQYQNFPTYEAVKIPYGEGNASMVIMLPHQDSSITDLNGSMDEKLWNDTLQTLDGCRKKNGTIWLPKFKAEYEQELSGILKTMGMSTVFSNQANLSGMIEPPDSGKIDKVLHKAVVEVDEKGTEAAAATAITIVRTTAIRPVDPPFFMKVDRPFFFAIEVDGVPLFYGSLKNPA